MNPTPANQPRFPLPTRSLLAASILGPLGTGILWLLIGWVGFSLDSGLTGLWSALIVTAVGLVADLLIQPWKPRPAVVWMNLWILHSLMRIAGTICLVILLYFATSPDPATLLFSYLLSFLVGLTWETVVWTGPLRKAVLPAAREQEAE